MATRRNYYSKRVSAQRAKDFDIVNGEDANNLKYIPKKYYANFAEDSDYVSDEEHNALRAKSEGAAKPPSGSYYWEHTDDTSPVTRRNETGSVNLKYDTPVRVEKNDTKLSPYIDDTDERYGIAQKKLSYMRDNGYQFLERSPYATAFGDNMDNENYAGIAYDEEMKDIAKPSPDRVMADGMQNAFAIMGNDIPDENKQMYYEKYLDGYWNAKRGLLSTPYQRDRNTGMPLYSFKEWMVKNRNKYPEIGNAVNARIQRETEYAQQQYDARIAQQKSERKRNEDYAQSVYDSGEKVKFAYNQDQKAIDDAKEAIYQKYLAEQRLKKQMPQQAQRVQQVQQQSAVPNLVKPIEPQQRKATPKGSIDTSIDNVTIYDGVQNLRNEYGDFVPAEQWQMLTNTDDPMSAERRRKVNNEIHKPVVIEGLNAPVDQWQYFSDVESDPKATAEQRRTATENKRIMLTRAILNGINATPNQKRAILVDGERNRAVRTAINGISNQLPAMYGQEKMRALTPDQKSALSVAYAEAGKKFVGALNSGEYKENPQTVLRQIVNEYNAQLNSAKINPQAFPSIFELQMNHIWYNNNLGEYTKNIDAYAKSIKNQKKKGFWERIGSAISTSEITKQMANPMLTQDEKAQLAKQLQEQHGTTLAYPVYGGRFEDIDKQFSDNPMLYRYMRNNFIPSINSVIGEIDGRRTQQEDTTLRY